MKKEYYYLINSEQIGPISEETLLSMQLAPATLVWCEGMANWQALSTISISSDTSAINSATTSVYTDPNLQTKPNAYVPQSGNDLLNSSFDYPKPKNYMTHSIVGLVLTLLFCTLIGIVPGILGIVYSNQVDSKYYLKDFIGAERASKNAKVCFIINMVLMALGFIIIIAYFIFIFNFLGSRGIDNLRIR